jgi:hypothetical protein
MHSPGYKFDHKLLGQPAAFAIVILGKIESISTSATNALLINQRLSV